MLLDVSELEVDKTHLIVRGLRSLASVLAELAILVSLRIGVDARLDEVELEMEGASAKVLPKARLDNALHPRPPLDTVAEHMEILEGLTRTSC